MKSVAVFCGSSVGGSAAYLEAAKLLGRLLAEKRITLVYGGGNIGLMGALANSVCDHGGRVIGVIPTFLMTKEVGLVERAELIVVQSMHERKAKMAELAEGFVAMPGGLGTLEEVAEILTWGQLGLHRKPVGLLNVGGFYDHLLAFFDHAVAEKLLKPKHRALVNEASTPGELLEKLAAAHVPYEPKVGGLNQM